MKQREAEEFELDSGPTVVDRCRRGPTPLRLHINGALSYAMEGNRMTGVVTNARSVRLRR